MVDSTNIPTVDQAFGPSTPTADEAFGPSEGPNKPGFGVDAPLKGPFADWFWQHTSYGKVLSAIGQGAEQGWGAVSTKPSEESLDALRKAGMINDYNKGQENIYKGFNESLLRGATWAAGTAQNVFGAGLGGAEKGLQQMAEETQGVPGLQNRGGNLFQTAAETLEYETNRGDIALHPFEPAPTFSSTVNTARAQGAIGEGEAGYFNTKSPTPEDLQARQTAAKEAGLPSTPAVTPPVRDPELVARQIDPDTFKEIDRLNELKDNLRQSLVYLASKRGEESEKNVTSILSQVGGDESKLTTAQATKLANERSIIEDTQFDDTSEVQKARQRLLDTDFQLRDLIPARNEALQHAQDLMPSPEERLEAESVPEPVATQQISDKTPGISEVTNLASLPNNEDQPITRAVSGSLKSVEGTGESSAYSLAKNTQIRAIKNGLLDDLSDLPESKSINMKDQADKVADYITNNLEDAIKAGMGMKEPPEGILPEKVYKGLEIYANQTGNSDLIRLLTTQSDIPRQARVMGQRLRALVEDDPNSAAASIKTVQSAREAALKKKGIDLTKAKLDTTKDIKASIEKNASNDWSSFIKSIECDY